MFERGSDPSRGLAESIPPSTHKLLEQIGVAAAIERAGFFRSRGNTAWWGSQDRRIEPFAGDAYGYQVFRPAFDRVLVAAAAGAGAVVHRRAMVRSVELDGRDGAGVEYEVAARRSTAMARFVLDCSGRAGVVARHVRVPQTSYRTYALVGVWQRRADGVAWDLPDDTHTAVETFADGWAWSVPTCATTRHCGVMVGELAPAGDDRTLGAAYRRALAGATQISRLVRGAVLERVFACDASLYSSRAYTGARHLLVGDAGSFIDPLSSFGVKKALASAWMAAVATHTALSHPERAGIALNFFGDWERRTYLSHLARTREFAAGARGRHASAYWERRASTAVAPIEDHETALAADPAVRRAYEAFRAAPGIKLALAEAARVEQRPVIRGHEIVLEPSLAGGLRFVANVDLFTLAQLAPHHSQVPDLFEAYCRTCSPVPLPSVVGGLSLLVARGILHDRA